MGNNMDRKKFLPLLLSSAMVLFWACGEGEIAKATDNDELAMKKIEEIDELEFAISLSRNTVREKRTAM